jgi:23S rRNA pseudouridine955/2504/2580 synthase
MSGVRTIEVAADEADLRLDRWFRRRFPGLGHGQLQKLLRTGQVRVDGGRAEAGQRLSAGQSVRVPPLPDSAEQPAEAQRHREEPLDLASAAAIRALVIHRDDHVIALNKPGGLAVQGGTGTHRHIDGLLDALRFGADERPRLVHRLDRDTSGLLLIARSASAAARLGEAFRGRNAEKVYWAVVAGVPSPSSGRIDLALAKRAGAARHGREAMAVDTEEGDRAITDYRVLDRAGRRAAWLELRPLTGRTHQLRVHSVAIGCPILGDFKYGGAAATASGLTQVRDLHLHARAIALPHPSGGILRLEADPPPPFMATLSHLGFDLSAGR